MAKKPRKDRKPVQEPVYDIEQVVSSTECTGFVPAPVQSESDADAYAAMYAIHRSKVDPEDR